jgi:NAD(P)-dependent dehydrogenase (short-subunit alcohol dehydrogenase family)
VVIEDVVRDIEAKGGTAMALRCDLANEDDIDNVVATTAERFGTIDILANIGQGGMDDHKTLLEATTRHLLDVFLTGPVAYLRFMQQCFPYMKAQGYGRIINTGSHSPILGSTMAAAYNAGKEVIMALSRTAAKDWGQYGIVTNTILPVARNGAGRFPDEVYEARAKVNPVRSWGDPYNDCAPVVVFLASEGARYVNGQVIGVDGGSFLLR